MKIVLDWYELLLWFLYLFTGLGFLYFYKIFNNFKNNHLISGYLLKCFGGLFLALIYVYYYPGGDTTLYYFSTKQFINILYENPKLFFDLLLCDPKEATELLSLNKYYIYFSNSDEEWFMLKISSFFCLMGFNSYLGMTYFFSILSLIGSLQIYKIFNQIILEKSRQIFYIVFLIPSVLIWGSGVLKDTFTLFGFNMMCFYLFEFIIRRKFSFLKLIFFISFSYLVFNLKAYIVFCFLPWIMITLFLYVVKRNNNPIAKFLIIPYLFILLFTISYFGTSNLLESSSDYKSKQLMKKVEGFQKWHNHLGGSFYDLGVKEFTPIGIISKAHLAINVSLFRPYLWESKTFLIMLNSIESLILLIFTIFVLMKTKMNVFGIIFNSPYLFGGFIFCLIFAFTIGITSYNFGALSRFKIPLLSNYIFILYYGYVTYKNEKLNGIRN
ncbi:MAG: hypothetical protein HYU67_08060 [Flavobacteriia bacterium]|nr:hypothetical protein [Flavobacteriia bacterium]